MYTLVHRPRPDVKTGPSNKNGLLPPLFARSDLIEVRFLLSSGLYRRYWIFTSSCEHLARGLRICVTTDRELVGTVVRPSVESLTSMQPHPAPKEYEVSLIIVLRYSEYK